MIEAKNLKKVYKTKKGVVVKALDDVSVKLPSTGMVFILGKSGSGKSTLLNVLGGLDSFDSGEIIIKGTSSKSFKQSHYDSYRNTYIGFIFQEYNVLEELTVGANIALAIELQGRKATDEEVNAILKEVDLDGYGARKPNELSGGQKQRVAIARALVKKPEIIMADEPTGALDSATGKQVFDTLKKLSRDKLVLIVSHDREFSEHYADRIIELMDGVIVSDVEKLAGSADESEHTVEADDSIVYGEGEISVKAGYSITEEDRIAINEYLAAIATGATIRVGGQRLKRRFSEKDFKPTDESAIKPAHDGSFKLIKSKLSVKNAFKIGSGGLKHKKVRLVFTILLSVIAFTLFGLADTIAAYDNIRTATNSIYDTGVNYASYIKSIKYGDNDYSYWSNYDTLLTPEDIENIKTHTGKNIVGVYKGEMSLEYSQNLGRTQPDGMVPSALYSKAFSGLAAVDSSMLSEHGFTLVGRIPEAGKNEIAVSKYVYDHFNKVGYMGYTDKGNEELKIESETDLIGKTLNLDIAYNNTNSFTIVGIIDTKFDYSRYERLADENAAYTMNAIEQMTLTQELEAAQNYSFACIGFVNSELINELLNKNAGEPEKVKNGNLQLYTLKDDSMIVDGEYSDYYGESGENVLASYWSESVVSLDKVKNDVIWLSGTPLTQLADNQVILNYYTFRELATGGSNHRPEVFYEKDKLVGIEKTMLDNCENWGIDAVSLDSIFYNPTYYAAVKFAYENPDAARDVFRNAGWDDSGIDSELSGTDVISKFANISRGWYSDGEVAEFDKVITASAVTEYLNGVIVRYNLSDYKTPEALKNMLIAEYTHEGKQYYSYDPNELMLTFQLSGSMEMVISLKLAAENFSDACNYYMANRGMQDSSELKYVRAYDIINDYASYLMGHVKDAPEGFTPVNAIDFGTEQIKLLAAVYKASPDTAKHVLIADCYATGTYRAIKELEIVGIVPDLPSGDFGMMRNYMVLSDAIINGLLGPNRGGIYDYAVGVMPADKAEINNIVKFAKTYINEEGNAKYQLSNNVTMQLDMVDEILEILGSVFLYVGIGFAVFASLMLTNFIGTSVTFKKQEIGILRAIGARSGDVFRIFFAESFIIAMINYVLSMTGTFVLTLTINGVLRDSAGILITFLTFGLRQIGILLLVSLGVAFIATFLPVKKIASMKPIDAIKNRK